MRRAALLRCGLAAGPLFVAVATIEGARRPDYNPVRHPISSLALGDRGWVQTVNFAVTGSLFLAAAAGASTRSRARLATTALGTAGTALLVSAAFVTDPVSGYPAGSPQPPEVRTRAGIVHDVSAVPIFLGLPALQLTSALRSALDGEPARAAYSGVSAAGMLVGVLGASAGFSGGSARWQPYGGLFQRLRSSAGWAG
jgi:hypothetical protein